MYVYKLRTRNELASFAHSIYTCLKHQLETSGHASDIILFRSTLGCIKSIILLVTLYGNLFSQNFVLFKNSQ